MFGNTLTKLRNRLGRVVLTQLSELKMHVRDEQLEADGKSRLKRRFEARNKDKGNSTNNQPPGGPGPTPPASTIQVESDATSNDDLNPPPAPGQEFRDIIDHHRQLVTNDNDGDKSDCVLGSLNSAIPKTLLTDLFNFTSDEWASKYNRYTRIGYDEELELYDLLEIDAEGDANDLDDFTQDILMN